MFDFDREIDRSGTMSLKWDKYKGQDVLPMWVADTDFVSPPPYWRPSPNGSPTASSAIRAPLPGSSN
jgi:hypothetical protein